LYGRAKIEKHDYRKESSRKEEANNTYLSATAG
jgi:hypothetical protein